MADAEAGGGPALPPSAEPVWQDYLMMAETKRRHFDYLTELELKYRHGGQPDARESAHLAGLLREHDAQVNAFRAGFSRLRIDEPAAYAALVARLAADAGGMN